MGCDSRGLGRKTSVGDLKSCVGGFVEVLFVLLEFELEPEVIVDVLLTLAFDSTFLLRIKLDDELFVLKFELLEPEICVVFGPLATAGLERVLNLNLLPVVGFFGDAINRSTSSSNFFIVFTYDAFDFSSLSISKELGVAFAFV